MPEESDVWRGHALQWERVGPPLRPRARDTEKMGRIADAWTSRHGSPEVLVLGVTPETARLDWPEGTDLLAVDRSRMMIDRVWPGFPSPGEGVLRADWGALPLADRSRDLVLGDGVFTVLAYPEDYRTLLASLRRILRPGGLFAVRTFVLPGEPERPAAVCRAAMAGEIGTFHAFKLRLLMALQPDPDTGVRTGDVWTYWSREGPAADDLAERSGWPRREIETIDAYRGREAVYSFPTLEELRSLAAEEGFEEVDRFRPARESDERCPTLVFTRRGEGGRIGAGTRPA